MEAYLNKTYTPFGNNFEETLINSLKKAASAGPALANAAMIVAKGCPKHYTEALTALYTANDLPCPDFTVLFQQHITVTPASEHSSEVDDVESILRQIEDVEELPASVNEVLDILTDFDTFEDSTHQSGTNESLLNIDDFQDAYTYAQPNTSEHIMQTNEQDLSLVDMDESISFENSPFAYTAPNLKFPSTPMLSPIYSENITFSSTPSHSRKRKRRITPNTNMSTRQKDSEQTPHRRTSFRPTSLAKSMSTLSQATSTPANHSRFNVSRTQTPPERSSGFSKPQSLTKDIPEDGESFLIISLSETLAPYSDTMVTEMSSRHIRESEPCIKSKQLLNYIRAIIS